MSARRGFCWAVRASHTCPAFPQGRKKGAATEKSCGGALWDASGPNAGNSLKSELCAWRPLRARRGFYTAVRASQAQPVVPYCRIKGAAAE